MFQHLLLLPLISVLSCQATAAIPATDVRTISMACFQACSQLSDMFGNYYHNSSSDSNFMIWDAKQQEVHPACRVEPVDASDVAHILRVLVANSCHFAVKGGGHSRSPGDSNSIGGVTIDLDKIRDVDIGANSLSAKVGGGATSAQVYAALEPYGLSFVGGRVGQVGIGGFTLGGGTYPFANKYGWALDNVYEFEVVLANSSIITVSEHTNADLYFALRGGANNFGIVTSFTVRVFPQGSIYISQISWNDSQSEEVLDRVYDLYTKPDLTSDVEMGYDLYYTYSPQSDNFVMSGTQRHETAMIHPEVFQNIDSIPTLSRQTRNATLANLTGSTPMLGTVRHLFDTLSILPSRELLSQAVQIFKDEITSVKGVNGLAPNLICYPLPTNAIKYMRRRGGNALGIDQEEPLFLILISNGWSNATDDTAMTVATENIVGRIRSAAKRMNILHPYLYLNYAASGRVSEVFAGYGKQNLDRLRRIQQQYDPDGIFTANGLWRGFMKLL